ncbi:hypothetical protein LWI29_024345 [Acer saccharum]|uniref:Myb/SANT-like domain-containing protein n=1 Tax=Acer saccharum TaxID=4024 RepID=A0AA39RY59_ACESA|nr:hypothetical protein LWI29_024345 [Acer saccharum]
MDTSKTKDPGQNKRFWTEEEDNKLIEPLLELNNNGRFKAEGSFKPGHLKELEKKLHEKLPRYDLLAKPHIESRMKTLKTHFHIVHDMLTGSNCSGFGWDIEKKTVTAEKPVWDAYIQKQRKTKRYGDLAEALTKSTATLAAVIEKSSARLSEAIGEDLNEKHMQLGEELSRTTTLTIMERHKVFRLIVQDNALVSYFFSLLDELKDDWAKGILARTI